MARDKSDEFVVHANVLAMALNAVSDALLYNPTLREQEELNRIVLDLAHSLAVTAIEGVR